MNPTKTLAALLAVLLATTLAGAQPEARAHGGDHTEFAGWFLRCDYTKTQKIDPIVYPNDPNPADGHDHDFFGGNVQPDSGYEQLRTDPTSCKFTDPLRSAPDHSGYWAPALYTRDGDKMPPVTVQAYARTGEANDAHDVTPWPNGSKLIVRASDPRARIGWFCAKDTGRGNNGDHRAAPYDCNNPKYPRLAVELFTPNCTIPGKRDSADHRSHYAHARDKRGGCPKSHPKEVPAMRLVFKYDAKKGQDLKVASHDSTFTDHTTFHADFFNAWSPDALDRLITSCIKRNVVCGEDGVAD